jgi:uncharacterized membrane protein
VHSVAAIVAAVKLVDILQGKWLGHPLHPAIVHVPIGAWLVTAVVDIAGRHAPARGTLPLIGLYCVAVGLIGALLAVPTGVADWTSIKKERPAWKLGLYHMALNALAAVVWAANFGLRFKTFSDPQPITTAIVATSVIGALLVLVSGYIGTLMVFDHGVSVGRQSKKKWRAIASRGGARLPEPK